MIGYLLKRISVLIPTFLGVTVIAFGLIRMVPGDPVLLMVGERGASAEAISEMRVNLGLDKPITTQYILFLKNSPIYLLMFALSYFGSGIFFIPKKATTKNSNSIKKLVM